MASRHVGPLTASTLFITLGLVSGSCLRPIAPQPTPAEAPRAARPTLSGWAEKTLGALTLEEKVAQMIGVRAFGIYTNPRSPEYQALIEEVETLKIGQITIFESDVYAAPKILNDLQRRSKIPLLVGADLERGLAFRVRRGVVPIPYAMAIGATRSEEAAYFAGLVTGREARAIGIHWAFAPVADVNNNPDNPVINIRSFGEDPALVGRLSSAYVRGARAGAILSTAKHFPGHGDTAKDSHLDLPSLPHDLERLRQVELLPFAAYAKAGLASVMTAHVIFDALEPGVPATMSARVMDGLLRKELGFQGVVVSDDLEMKAISEHFSVERAVVEGVKAGVDCFLVCHHASVQRAAIEALVKAVESGEVKRERVLEARARIDAMNRRFVHGPEDRLGTLGTPAHEALRRGLSVDTFTGKDPTEVVHS